MQLRFVFRRENRKFVESRHQDSIKRHWITANTIQEGWDIAYKFAGLDPLYIDRYIYDEILNEGIRP